MSGLKLIACVDQNLGIGRDGHLLFDIPEDRRLFHALTMGSAVIMGRKTWESLPKRPLADRINIIVSRTMPETIDMPGTYVVRDPVAALSIVEMFSRAGWVIGGGQIYHEMFRYCDTAYLTYVNADGHADTFLQDWKWGNRCWNGWSIPGQAGETKEGYTWGMSKWERI